MSFSQFCLSLLSTDDSLEFTDFQDKIYSDGKDC